MNRAVSGTVIDPQSNPRDVGAVRAELICSYKTARMSALLRDSNPSAAGGFSGGSPDAQVEFRFLPQARLPLEAAITYMINFWNAARNLSNTPTSSCSRGMRFRCTGRGSTGDRRRNWLSCDPKAR